MDRANVIKVSVQVTKRVTLAITLSSVLFASAVFGATLSDDEAVQQPAPMPVVSAADPTDTDRSMPAWTNASLSQEEITSMYAQASWVAYVRVSQVRQRVNVALSLPQMYAIDSVVYGLTVLNQWKGDNATLAQLEVADEDCPAFLEQGGEYIIFASGPSSALISNQCSQLIPFQPNSQTVAVLNDLYSQSFAVVNVQASMSENKLP